MDDFQKLCTNFIALEPNQVPHFLISYNTAANLLLDIKSSHNLFFFLYFVSSAYIFQATFQLQLIKWIKIVSYFIKSK